MAGNRQRSTPRRRRRCAYLGCREPFTPKASGRPPLYCSDTCRQAAHRERLTPRSRRLIRLIEGDARQLLPRLPSASVDLVVTDPPYLFERGSGRHQGDWFTVMPAQAWPGIFAELHRLLAADRACYVFCDPRTKPLFDAAAAAAGFTVRRALVWDKGAIGLGGAWRAQYELIGHYEKGHAPYTHSSWGDVRRHRRVRGYPTEKPAGLLAELITQSSAPGWHVLDPFCGSGSAGRAAARLGRRATLIDLDAAAASRRLRLTAEQPEAANVAECSPRTLNAAGTSE